MSEMFNISLCICTYNRCEGLAKTIETLSLYANELIEGDEVLIVDNNSTDQTKEIVRQYKSKLPVEYYFEPTQGLSSARNRGLAEFNNDIIVFIDDDISISPQFLNEYRSAFEKFPEIGFFGGKIHIDWQDKKPNWFNSTDLPLLNGMFGYFDQGDEEYNFDGQSLLPYGANFAMRRDMIDAVGMFDLTLGVKGGMISRGEETDYFNRCLKGGHQGRYIPNAKVYHRFQIERISLHYLYRYGFQKGIAAVKLDNAKPQNMINKLSYQVVSGFYQLLKFRRDRFYQCVINVGLLRGIANASKGDNHSNS